MRAVFRGCFLCGLPVSMGLMCCMAACMTAVDLPPLWYPAAAALPLAAGCFCAGFAAGCRARTGGWRCGFCAALLLSLSWYAAACIMSGTLRSLMLLVLLLPCGVCGGICGVNTRQPIPHRRVHAAAQMRERLVLRRKLLHKPKHHAENGA